MRAATNPEVLAHDWLPPVALAREREVRDAVCRIDAPRPQAPPPWVLGIAGPPGSGTSTIARRAARETVDRLRAAGAHPSVRLLAVRTPLLRGTHGVATSILQRFDDGFDGRGFPTAEIIAGILRRVRREGCATVIVLDDVGVGGADLSPLVKAFGEPDRFLPEGESGLPPLWTVVAGTREGLSTALSNAESRFPVRPFVELAPYSETALRAIVRDRLERACGPPCPEAVVERIVAQSVADGLGARRAIDLVRREVLGGRTSRRSARAPIPVLERVPVEPRVLRAIGAASQGIVAPIAEVRRFEAELASRQGLRPLPTTTLWRRLVRLERAGYLRREIRTGGSGGSRSVLRLLSPIDEWVTDPCGPGTPRGFDALSGGPVDPAEAPEAARCRAEDGLLEG